MKNERSELFHIRLRELRGETGAPLRTVAKQLEISLSAYSNYEQGLREPSLVNFRKICDYFDVSADYLLGRADIY